MGRAPWETAEGEVGKNGRMRRKVTVRELQDESEELLTTVVDGGDCVAITRDGRPAAALVPFERYAGLLETVEILSDVDAIAAIETGLAELRHDQTVDFDTLRRELAERRRGSR